VHPRTKATLAQLDAATWFEHVGEPGSDNVIVLTSWQEALASCSGEDWRELLQEAVNQFAERLVELDRNRFNQWNALVDELKAASVPLVTQKIAGVVAAFELPKAFSMTVQWDILHACLEAEYADIFPPAFYASQAYWYVTGRFPCGWSGQFPEGKLVIY
jgi:hypothetical protein